MTNLPMNVRLTRRRCVVIGGGSVAVRRAASLLDAGANVCVIAPTFDVRLENMPIERHARQYQRGDLAGARLAVIASDDPQTNAAAAEEAATEGALVNRADDPKAGDLTFPAVHRAGPITLTVDTGGVSAAAAATIRDQLASALDPDWSRLLTLAAPHRRAIQAAQPEGEIRRDRLRKLTNAVAMNILKARGEAAYTAHCRKLTAADDNP